ncbi:hypothetical protein JCM10450v2_008078 [Rhodotorula kratochvilovae]
MDQLRTGSDAFPSRAPAIKPLSLAAVSSSVASTPQGVFRGRIASIRDFSPHTRLTQLTLASLDSNEPAETRLEIELKGDWAAKASRRFLKGDVLVLSTKGVAAVESKGKGREGEKEKPPRVRLERGLTGWLQRQNGVEEFVQYKVPAKKRPVGVPAAPAPPQHAQPLQPLPRAAKPPSRPPAALPSAHTLPPANTNLAKAIPPEQPAQSRAAPASAPSTVPAKRRAQSLPAADGPLTSESTPLAKEQKVSPPGEGTRSVKRRKKEEKLGWGFSAADGTTYTALDKLGELVEKTQRSKLQSTKINIVAVVVDEGEVCEPRIKDRDWYRPFRIVDPTTLGSPIEVQWYAKGAGGVPSPQNGDIFLAQLLVLKSTSTPSAPILLAKSFAVVPHALLRPAALRAAPPAQDPLPPPAGAEPPVTSAGRHVLRLGEEELAYAARVAKAAKGAAGAEAGLDQGKRRAAAGAAGQQGAVGGQQRGAAGVGGRPFLRVEEVTEGQFCDMIGMVTKIHCSYPFDSVPSSCAASLYITDYTSHPLLHSYDTPASVGLAGQLVLQLSLFGTQATPLAALIDPRTREARRGALVHVRNVRIKVGAAGALEGTLWEEREERFRGRRDVTIVDLRKKEQEVRWGERAREVQRRHREYWAALSVGAGAGGSRV